MVTCPIDGMTELNPGENPCHQCGADLTLFWRIHTLKNMLFNSAIDCAAHGHEENAANFLSALKALGGNDEETDKFLDNLSKIRKVKEENDDTYLPDSRILVTPVTLSHYILFSGLVLFFISSTFGLLTGLHYSDPNKIRLVVTCSSVGGALALIGAQSAINKGKPGFIPVSGYIIVLLATALFAISYAGWWHYPYASFVLVLYLIGIAILGITLLSSFFSRASSKDNYL